MNILFLSRWYPFPPNNGSKLRIYNLLQGLCEHHEVVLLSFAESSEITPKMERPISNFKEIHFIPRKPFNPLSKKARLGFLSKTPRSFIDTFSPELVASIHEILNSDKFDLVIASQVDMAAYGRHFQELPAIFEEAEVGILYEQFKNAASFPERLRYWLTWNKHKRFLLSTLKYFKAATVVSQPEKSLLSEAISNHPPIKIIPNGVDVQSYRDFQEIRKPNTMIFAGAFSFSPNYEAMQWFVGEALPIIQENIPTAELTITGNHLDLPLPKANYLNLTGLVDDVRPLIAQSTCSVVPILSGGGTRLKILEAVALGTPVITTTKGVEGLDLTPGDDILVGDNPKEFADAVIKVLTDAETGQKLATNALKKVQENYDWAQIVPDLLDLAQKVIDIP